jgi:adenine-specific DNA-methyltransferase
MRTDSARPPFFASSSRETDASKPDCKWSNMTVELTERLDVVRRSLKSSSSRHERSRLGQFLTPAMIARFMASLFHQQSGHVRILDAGAGAGVLFAACLEAFLSGQQRLLSIEVVAYENDRHVLSVLKETMERCESVCRGSGISFRGVIKAEDFVAAAVAQTEESLFAVDGKRFTHAILNPPYKKINSQTATRRLLDAAGVGVTNLYAAFVWLAVRMLEPGGELVAITPRSFCNGPYFRRFRISLLDMISLRRIHVFQSRMKAFGDDDVLQENVIYHGVRGQPKPGRVMVSSSEGLDFDKLSSRSVPYEHMVLPGDRAGFIHLVLNDADNCIMERMGAFTTSLAKLGVHVSTGRVVDFRAREYLRPLAEDGTAPLIHPCHLEDGFVSWPVESGKKPNAILSSAGTRGLLVRAGYYVLTRRFSAKEEPRRVVAAVYDPNRIEAPFVGFENHLNYFHAMGKGLDANLAKGLALYLNSSLFDQYFRLFSGHTQVNAMDLRRMRYPSREQMLRLGARMKDRMPDQRVVDAMLEEECNNNG